MAATGRSRTSSVLCPLSSPETLLNHHQRSSASLCNINLCLKRFFPGNTPKTSAASKCLCSPTTHPGSFRCAFHRRLESEKNRTLNSQAKPNKCGNMTKNSGLNMRKTALLNSLVRIASVEADRVKKSLAASMVTPSPLHISRRFDFRPRPSRFYALRKDQDLISSRLWPISCVRRNYLLVNEILTRLHITA